MTEGRRQQAIDALRDGAQLALDLAARLDEGASDWDDLAADAEHARDQIGAAEEMLAENIDESQYAGDDEPAEATS